MSGLLSGIGDPEFMARLEERNRLVAKLAAQMGIPHDEARRSLQHWEQCTSSDGQDLQ